MNTHDILSFALAGEVVRRIRQGDMQWSLFSSDVYATASRTWPLPDFVVVDNQNHVSIAAEFKPPDQTKREYLTGLGQTIAYTRDFHYGLLVIPEVSDDDYRIADHIAEVMAQDIAKDIPVGLIKYDPRTISATTADFIVLRELKIRTGSFTQRASTDNSFWAKWRDISPQEMGRFIEYLYDEGRPEHTVQPSTVRDRAFDRLWGDIQAGNARHWGGGIRTIKNTSKMKVAWSKNYRNFVAHIGWVLADGNGKLTEEGLAALRIAYQYGSDSRIFLDFVAKSVLLAGKHLVLINEINEFQDHRYRTKGAFSNEELWLDEVELYLEERGLLKRNPGRHAVAVQQSIREFLKAEKTLWRNLELFIPAGPQGGRVYHKGRGFMFDWARITALIS